jgi:hypothetical protein
MAQVSSRTKFIPQTRWSSCCHNSNAAITTSHSCVQRSCYASRARRNPTRSL